MNSNLTPLVPVGHAPAIGLTTSTVTGLAEKWFFLASSDPTSVKAQPPGRALRADSCLLTPECGDVVLVCNGVAVELGTVSYILAVLSRAQTAQGTLALPGGASLVVDKGALLLKATEIAVQAKESIHLAAPRIKLSGTQGDVQFNRLRASAAEFKGVLGHVSTVAQSVTSTVGRLVQKTKDSFRWTENLDETRAGRMRLQVAERFHLKSRHASVIAEGQVKIDGEKIDLG